MEWVEGTACFWSASPSSELQSCEAVDRIISTLHLPHPLTHPQDWHLCAHSLEVRAQFLQGLLQIPQGDLCLILQGLSSTLLGFNSPFLLFFFFLSFPSLRWGGDVGKLESVFFLSIFGLSYSIPVSLSPYIKFCMLKELGCFSSPEWVLADKGR